MTSAHSIQPLYRTSIRYYPVSANHLPSSQASFKLLATKGTFGFVSTIYMVVPPQHVGSSMSNMSEHVRICACPYV